jgi:DNA polymerase-4
LAKTAADMQKPDGLTLIGVNELPQRLHGLKLRDFCGIGRQMEQRLERAGLETVEKMCAASEDQLGRVWGSPILGSAWYRKLRGEDVAEPPMQRRTVSHSHVLPPELRREETARRVLIRLVHKVGMRLRNLRYWAKRLDIHVTYLGDRFWQGGARLPPTQDTLTFINVVNDLWTRKPPGRLLKIGVVLSELVAHRNTSGSLWEAERQRHSLSRVMDDVNQRFGAHAVYFGGMHDMQDQAPSRIAFTNIPDLSIPG